MRSNAYQKKSLGGGRVSKKIVLMAALGWISAGLLAADRVDSSTMNNALQNALVRSHSEHRALSQEVQRVSTEMNDLQKRLTKYQNR